MSDAMVQEKPVGNKATSNIILDVQDLKIHFPILGGFFDRQVGSVKAVDGVSFQVHEGETLGLVGESGCGKSTTGLAVLRMLPITSGKIVFEGVDITNHTPSQMRPIRRRIQMVYQDPFGSLDPRMTVAEIVGEPLEIHNLHGNKNERRERVMELMEMVGLRHDMIDRYPHQFSGGQRQRISIARALAVEPRLLICDEPVSALDVSIQAQVVNLFQELQEKLGISSIFVAHDLAVVRHVSQRIAVMYLGTIVEISSRDELYANPKHPYTKALMAAIPVANPVVEASRTHQIITGEVPSAQRPPPGCRFHPRCPLAMPICKEEFPQLRPEGSSIVACHLYS
jgi:oligopeptide transport system ATP-binding protein